MSPPPATPCKLKIDMSRLRDLIRKELRDNDQEPMTPGHNTTLCFYADHIDDSAFCVKSDLRLVAVNCRSTDTELAVQWATILLMPIINDKHSNLMKGGHSYTWKTPSELVIDIIAVAEDRVSRCVGPTYKPVETTDEAFELLSFFASDTLFDRYIKSKVICPRPEDEDDPGDTSDDHVPLKSIEVWRVKDVLHRYRI